jgi:hypothetical protein
MHVESFDKIKSKILPDCMDECVATLTNCVNPRE